MSVSFGRETSAWMRSSLPSLSLSKLDSTHSSWLTQFASPVAKTGCAMPLTNVGTAGAGSGAGAATDACAACAAFGGSGDADAVANERRHGDRGRKRARLREALSNFHP